MSQSLMMSNGVCLHQYGDLNSWGPALLLIHGFASSAADWQTVAGTLAGHLPVLAVDLPGYGGSSLPAGHNYTISFVLEMLGAALNELGLQQVIPAGYSMGGRVALHFALHAPELCTALILESTSPGIRSPEEQVQRARSDEQLAAGIAGKGIEWFEEFWSKQPIFATQSALPPDVQGSVRQQRLACTPAVLAATLRGMGQGVIPHRWDELHFVETPCLLISGGEDTKYTALNREMNLTLHHSRHVTVEGAGHNVHLEKPDEFVKLVINFLNQQRVTGNEISMEKG